MRTVDLIQKKRDGGELTSSELQYLLDGYCNGGIPDYQMSAWAMAVYSQGMTARETADLTMIMANSGDRMDLSAIQGIKVDKHSTGGVGDTTTLVLAALVAAADVPVAKMSGRGLGHTGGTIDKLESIPGFRVEQTQEQFIQQMNNHGVAVISQSGNITPADKKLYSLRDVTATVESIPLIASSIMSKKIASGADAIVLDVKTGSGAFMKTIEQSIALAKAMVEIGEQVGRETTAVISSMDQPLGYAVGNALEVQEAVDTLRGKGPPDLEQLCLVLGAYMLMLGGKAQSYEQGIEKLIHYLHNGYATKKFKELIAAQGGSPAFMDQPGLLPSARHIIPVLSPQSGYVTAIIAEEIGMIAMMLGAGRETKESIIDLSAGILLKKKVGDYVEAGEILADLHTNKPNKPNPETGLHLTLSKRLKDAYLIEPQQKKAAPLILAVVTKSGVSYWLNE